MASIITDRQVVPDFPKSVRYELGYRAIRALEEENRGRGRKSKTHRDELRAQTIIDRADLAQFDDAMKRFKR